MTTQQISNYKNTFVNYSTEFASIKLPRIRQQPAIQSSSPLPSINVLLIDMFNHYTTKAKNTKNPQQAAFYYSNIRATWDPNLGISEKLLMSEVESCLEASKQATNPKEKVEWLYPAVKLLESYPVNSSNHFEILAQLWEKIGDLILEINNFEFGNLAVAQCYHYSSSAYYSHQEASGKDERKKIAVLVEKISLLTDLNGNNKQLITH